MSSTWKTLLRENLKRQWLLTVTFFILLVLCSTLGAVGAMVNGDKDFIIISLRSLCSFDNAGFLFLIALYSICAGIGGFSFLHKTAAVSGMHMLPASRKTIYTSKIASGLISLLGPTLLNGVIVSLIFLAVGFPGGCAKAVMWLLTTITMEVFVYALTVLAGMLCGTVLMHTIGSIGLVLLTPGLIVIINYFCYSMLKGYVLADLWRTIVHWTNPIATVYVDTGSLSLIKCIYFILLSIAILAVALMLYKKRDLERATDSIVFSRVEPYITFIITLALITIVEIYTSLVVVKYVGLVIGFIVIYPLITMLVEKSRRVLTKKTFRNMGISALIIGMMIGVIGLDVFHYNDVKINPTSIKYADTGLISTYAENTAYEVSPGGDNSRFRSKSFIKGGSEITRLYDKENIKTLAEMSRACSRYSEGKGSLYTLLGMFSDKYYDFEFVNSSVDSIKRTYEIEPNPEMEKYVKKIYESKEFKELYSIKNFRWKDKFVIDYYPTLDSSYRIASQDRDGLIEAMDKDFADRKFEDEKVNSKSFAGSVMLRSKGDEYDRSLCVMVRDSDKNTIKWLKEHGYMFGMPFEDVNIGDISLERANYDSSGDSFDYAYALVDPDKFSNMSLRDFMVKYSGDLMGDVYTHRYTCTLTIKSSGTILDGTTVTILYDEDNVPDFVKKAEYKEEE